MKRCMFEQKRKEPYKETPEAAFAGSGVSLLKTYFTAPFRSVGVISPGWCSGPR